MDKSFDPYLKWLGIRSGGRKVNHYRLLGLELFESDADVIANAAERHIKHVESFVEEHPTEAHQVIGELYAARDCLLSPEKKIQYDQRLGKKLNGNQQEQAPVIKTTNEDSPPDFAGINVTDSAPQVGNKSARPVIRPSKQRRKKKSGSFDIAGWILGAVGAIVFAYVLINTDLIDRIRGREGEVVKNEDPIEPNVNRPAEVTDKPSKPERPERNKNTNENRQPIKPDPVKAESESSSTKVEVPETFTNPNSTVTYAPKIKPVPSADLIKKAQEVVNREFSTELSSGDRNLKRIAARRLMTNVDSRAPEEQYARLQTAARLAGEAGELTMLTSSIEKMEERFEGVDFVSLASKPLQKALSSGKSLESMSRGLEKLLEKAQVSESWQVCIDLANDASDLAKKSGDRLQQDMLKQFAKDMVGMLNMHKKFKLLEDKTELTAKEKLDKGKYVCFGRNDWKNGLPLLAESSDGALAAVAKTDLGATIEGRDTEAYYSVAKAWAELSKKTKYKRIADRRFMLVRALQLLDDSTGISYTEQLQAENSINQQIAVFKIYETSLNALAGETVEFDVKGWATFDRAAIENGRLLKLGLNNQVRTISLLRRGDYFGGRTRDGKIRFEIRPLKYGVVEMKMFDNATDSLQNILYGK